MVLGFLNAIFINNVLKRNGTYAFSFNGGYFNEVKDILKLSKTASNKNDKIKYLFMGWLDIVLTVGFVVLTVLFLKYFPF